MPRKSQELLIWGKYTGAFILFFFLSLSPSRPGTINERPRTPDSGQVLPPPPHLLERNWFCIFYRPHQVGLHQFHGKWMRAILSTVLSITGVCIYMTLSLHHYRLSNEAIKCSVRCQDFKHKVYIDSEHCYWERKETQGSLYVVDSFSSLPWK